MWSFWTGFLPPALGGGLLVVMFLIVVVMCAMYGAGCFLLWDDERLKEKEKRVKRLKSKERNNG